MANFTRADVKKTTPEIHLYKELTDMVDNLKAEIEKIDPHPSGTELTKKKALKKQLETSENKLKKCLERMDSFKFLYVTNEEELKAAKRYKEEEKYVRYVVEEEHEHLVNDLDANDWLPVYA